MTSLWLITGSLGFGLSALCYGVICLLISSAHPGSRGANWLLGATAVSSLWSALLLYLAWAGSIASPAALIADAAHVAAWTAFFAVTMKSSASDGSATRLSGLVLFSTGAALAIVSVAESVSVVTGIPGQSRPLSYFCLLLLPLLGLFAIELVYRNSGLAQRRIWRPMSLAVGAIFAVNIFAYSQAVLLGQIVDSVWATRGVVSAFVAPVILLAVKRQPDWEKNLFVSRHAVFYAASLGGAGLYLIIVAAGGYLVGSSDAFWGPIVQILFLVLAALVLLYAIFSPEVRARMKVLIAKHFYRNRYDYREEWLRLIATLSSVDGPASPAMRGIEALASIVGSQGGVMWLRDPEGGNYELKATWNDSDTEAELAASDPIIEFMKRRRWIVDTEEYQEDPEKYANAFEMDEHFSAQPAIFVPLVHEEGLIGVVRLRRPAAMDALSFEDHDLLRTAGQQVAIFMAQELAKEELSETRQLEAFSKLTTFLMHDLKNLIAQQELVVGNAKRFGHRKEFMDDAIRTIDMSVQRMRKVLSRLQETSNSAHASRFGLAKLLREVCDQCSDREPQPALVIPQDESQIDANRERLGMAFTHAIRNAQDACDGTGSVEVRLTFDGPHAVVEVCDDGVGMDSSFVQERLFKPFDSTKGARGMGIGAYQLRDTLRAANGSVEVVSEPGKGTTLRMTLPLAVGQESI